ncbi:TadE-like protein [Lutimaribacter pacificus]|uniref:TadE-like protein n=1 Tax=Lutimaribacter pacificus TaxID=391948 RepID=A0A1H0B9R1_9RHOB|nr:TadE/TadG family type IV pilus assembly protein [Lutimaribacter pacificus]SDN42361.1 TadE-like protein [Lutimaribacter pacificus]SHJ58754.1 TadE-like protein [Lutimaribacter pacificus]
MTPLLPHRLARFHRDEGGNSTIEFVIWFPLFIFLLLAAVEISIISVRQTTLERAMDMTVRDIRLGTGTAPQHNDIKNLICDRAAMVPDCRNNLRLEMVQVDPKNFVPLPEVPDCTDQSEEVRPVRAFSHGMDNQLMILRACAKFKPFFPLTGVGKELSKDNAGYAAVTATTAFVQEPR